MYNARTTICTFQILLLGLVAAAQGCAVPPSPSPRLDIATEITDISGQAVSAEDVITVVKGLHKISETVQLKVTGYFTVLDDLDEWNPTDSAELYYSWNCRVDMGAEQPLLLPADHSRQVRIGKGGSFSIPTILNLPATEEVRSIHCRIIFLEDDGLSTSQREKMLKFQEQHKAFIERVNAENLFVKYIPFLAPIADLLDVIWSDEDLGRVDISLSKDRGYIPTLEDLSANISGIQTRLVANVGGYRFETRNSEDDVDKLLAGSNPKATGGDSLILRGDDLVENSILIHGVDSFENGQKCEDQQGSDIDCAKKSRGHLDKLISGQQISCRVKSIVNGVNRARCLVDSRDIGAVMVSEGWAFSNQVSGAEYIGLMEEAKKSNKGAWKYKFDMPWKYRIKKVVEEIEEKRKKQAALQGR